MQKQLKDDCELAGECAIINEISKKNQKSISLVTYLPIPHYSTTASSVIISCLHITSSPLQSYTRRQSSQNLHLQFTIIWATSTIVHLAWTHAPFYWERFQSRHIFAVRLLRMPSHFTCLFMMEYHTHGTKFNITTELQQHKCEYVDQSAKSPEITKCKSMS